MSKPTLQERRASLAQDIADIQEQYKNQLPAAIGRTSPDFLEKYTGMFAGDPLFEKMLHGIEERRERERQEAMREADEAEAAE